MCSFASKGSTIILKVENALCVRPNIFNAFRNEHKHSPVGKTKISIRTIFKVSTVTPILLDCKGYLPTPGHVIGVGRRKPVKKCPGAMAAAAYAVL